MIRLADVAHHRDNNFHLLRVIAASAVLYSHAFALATGDKASEPLRSWLGCTFGSIAVDLFFLISGMLVTMSLERRGSAVDFVRARFLRIWPALTVAIFLSVFVLGAVFTTSPLREYFLAKGTVKYLVFNLWLFRGVEYFLPGVFLTNPWPAAINGSLWSLTFEVKCYVVLLAAWIVLRRLQSAHLLRWLTAALWASLLAWFVWTLHSMNIEDSPARVWLMFCSGVLIYLLRSRLLLSWWWLGALCLAVGLSLGHPVLFGLTYAFALPYFMLCCAYLPRGGLLRYNRLGDYSYGIYIYAFPVQQSLMHLMPGLLPLEMFGLSLAVTLGLAVLSWHFVEKPALAFVRPRKNPSTPLVPAASGS